MIGLLVRLALFVMIVVMVYRLYRKFVKRVRGAVFGDATPFSNSEKCPSCHSHIRVSKEPGDCPQCGIPLGRSPSGELLIRVN